MQPNAEVLASRLRTKLVASGLPAQPPVLRRLEARAIPVSEQRELRTYQFLVGQDVRASSGQELQMRPEHAKLRLERLMTGPRVTFRDEDLKTYRVRVLGGVRIGEVDRRVQGETERYLAVTARLLLLNQTALASATYDAGDAYDDSTRRYDG